jgi:hypothetical protein
MGTIKNCLIQNKDSLGLGLSRWDETRGAAEERSEAYINEKVVVDIVFIFPVPVFFFF